MFTRGQFQAALRRETVSYLHALEEEVDVGFSRWTRRCRRQALEVVSDGVELRVRPFKSAGGR
jgi:hypothetical protein